MLATAVPAAALIGALIPSEPIRRQRVADKALAVPGIAWCTGADRTETAIDFSIIQLHRAASRNFR